MTAVVTSLAEVDGTNDGTPMHGNYRYMRVYSRLPSGTWKITNFEATRVGSLDHGRTSSSWRWAEARTASWRRTEVAVAIRRITPSTRRSQKSQTSLCDYAAEGATDGHALRHRRRTNCPCLCEGSGEVERQQAAIQRARATGEAGVLRLLGQGKRLAVRSAGGGLGNWRRWVTVVPVGRAASGGPARRPGDE